MNNYELTDKSDVISLGYNAVEDIGRRQSPQTTVKQEEIILTAPKRQRLQATAQEEFRNHALLAWMVRKHINYVTAFDPHIRTGIDEIDERIIKLVQIASKKENFDIEGRHDRSSALKMFESMKVLAGDSLFLKLESGHVQGIESDRIKNPGSFSSTITDEINAHGLVLNKAGKALKYCICNRGDNGQGYEFDQLVDFFNVIYDGYFFRFDQVRGISPLSTAINSCQDLAEVWEWTLLKIKVHALFGIAIKHDSPTGTNYQKEGYTANEQEQTSNTSAIPNQFKPSQGIMTLDLKPGDSVEAIESRTPSSEMTEYSKLMIRVTLLALDIPFTTFDSMASSFSAMIADRILYEEAAKDKREKNKSVLTQWSDWKIDNWMGTDKKLIDACNKNSKTAEDIKDAFDWIPSGTPWLDKTKEVDGDTRALAIGADSTPRICKRRGLDAFKLIDEQSDFLAYAKSKGVPIMIGQPGQEAANPQDPTPDKPNAENNDEVTP